MKTAVREKQKAQERKQTREREKKGNSIGMQQKQILYTIYDIRSSWYVHTYKYIHTLHSYSLYSGTQGTSVVKKKAGKKEENQKREKKRIRQDPQVNESKGK